MYTHIHLYIHIHFFPYKIVNRLETGQIRQVLTLTYTRFTRKVCRQIIAMRDARFNVIVHVIDDEDKFTVNGITK